MIQQHGNQGETPKVVGQIVSHLFRVSVGHASVVVEAEDAQQAVGAARRKLCLELPRMWDVISTLADHRFRVRPAG